MGEIYRTAKEVLIWLGEDANGIAAKSFSILRRIVVARGSQKPTIEEKRLLVDFFEKPWFDRRWIIQEVTNARKATLYCGSTSLELSWFLSA